MFICSRSCLCVFFPPRSCLHFGVFGFIEPFTHRRHAERSVFAGLYQKEHVYVIAGYSQTNTQFHGLGLKSSR